MIVVFGSLNADLIFKMEEAPQAGQTLLANSMRMEAGGKGANQAVAAARLGAPVAMVGAVGSDALATIALENLATAGVDISAISQERDSATGCASVIVTASGQNQIAVALGANLASASAQVTDTILSKADLLVLQMESRTEEVCALIERASMAEVPVLLNLAPAIRLPNETLKRCSYLVVNEDEAEALAGWLDCQPTATSLNAALDTAVIRTLGSKGSEAAINGQFFQVAAYPVIPVDTTAAGDCFIGALASGLQRKLSLEGAMKEASVAASLACTHHGSQSSLPWQMEVQDFLTSSHQ